MNILIAHASEADAAFFSSALPAHDLSITASDPETHLDGVEALSVPHGKFVSADLIDRMPKLRLIVTRSTGFDHVDVAAARARNITVCNVPEYGSTTVAEFTFGLILCLARKIPDAVASSRKGHFSVGGLMGVDLEKKTLGIVGLGKIGKHVARMAGGFDMKVIYFDPFVSTSTPLDVLLGTSDFVAVCCPLTETTHHMMNASALASMKPGAFLINTGRGPIVDSEALLAALENGHLAGAGLDVLEGEETIGSGMPGPFEEVNKKLMNHPKVLVTPHLAFDSVEALGRIRQTTVDVLLAFSEGRVLNAV